MDINVLKEKIYTNKSIQIQWNNQNMASKWNIY